MSLLKKPSPRLGHPSPPLVESETTWLLSGNIARLATLAAIAGITLFGPLQPLAHAKSGHKVAAKQEAAKASDAIDPDAMEALNKMGTYLRTLNAFQVNSETSTDDVLDDGEIVTDTHKATLLASRPNHLRVEIKDDDRDTFLFYDGKDFTVYGKLVNFYATAPAPPTTAELIKKISDNYGIEVPLVDLFLWGTDESSIKKITSAIDLGPATVDDVTCEHYAFRQEGIDWQIWIQLGDFPLPQKLAIRTLTDEARPLHVSNLTWHLAPSFNDAAFTFDPPEDAKRIAFRDLNSDATKNAK